ncbi:carboxymuconolactone decarboxylase family protein [Paraburkholderia jirisanensis]
MEIIRSIGDEGFDSLSAALDRLDPGFKRLLIEGGYAGLIARPDLALKQRELITVAMLATMGNAESALKYHAAGMLNTGWPPEALLETVLHTLVYAGVPAALAGVRIVAAVFDERGIGIEHVSRRQALTPRDRELATLAIAIARENQSAAVRLHLEACLRLGWTRSELTEVLIQSTGYVGWPLILPLTRIALEVFEEAGADMPAAAAATLPGFALPKGVADLSPVVAHYVEALGLQTSPPESKSDARARRLSDIASLTCLARSADTEVLSAYVKEALSLGATRQQIVDAILSAMPHAGVLPTRHGLSVANDVFDRQVQTTTEIRT